MGTWMKPRTVLSRLVENDQAPIMARVRALQQLEHPNLEMLRRLLVEKKTPRKKEIPAKLKALASLKYVEEMRLRQMRRMQRVNKNKTSDNALGI
jgi:hypothetical protein